MNFFGDTIVENLRLRKAVLFWKVVTLAVGVGLVFVCGSFFSGEYISDKSVSPYIARVALSGFIDYDLDRDRRIASFAYNPKIKAVILHINSPGGAVAASEALYNALKSVAQVKPLVVVSHGVMASGAYMAAMAADHIIAHNSSIVGSVGVMVQVTNLHDLASRIGVKMEVVRSGRLKALPSTFEKVPNETRFALQRSVNAAGEYFLSLVTKRRRISDPAVIEEISTGKVFLGTEAIAISLIDEIGDENNAVEWLKQNGVTGKIKNLSLVAHGGFQLSQLSPSSFLEAWRLFGTPYSGLLAVFPGAFYR
ncbi:signal peptide peptidase SppA, 36K type [Neorickettsia helminthoeca str. Oregon]|uniref:Signal peptide peptidase SppA, 36K type n=1 Tax=Neorickettsia helminthoeca str. Oregon TaxID=1286528 RepID=X5HJR9_9RICK|nr:signal peptide peptidase SppA [Neorickettsia helminthoeca]AHX11339.1 signal peptide peptidase SppA, 36K type [Neorickettsia helminthoeca str. Oregon]